MGKRNSLPEGGHTTHPNRALQKTHSRHRRAKKLEHREMVERSKQDGKLATKQNGKLASNNSIVYILTCIANLGIPSIANTDEEDRMRQREGSRWLKEYLESKQPDLLLKDRLGLHRFFSVKLAKHVRPDPYDLGIDAQNIIDRYKSRIADAYEAEEDRRADLRRERMERDVEQARMEAYKKVSR